MYYVLAFHIMKLIGVSIFTIHNQFHHFFCKRKYWNLDLLHAVPMFLYASMFLSLQWAFKSHAAFTTRLFCRLSARLFSELGLCLVLLGLSTLEALQRAPSEHLTKFSLHKIPAAPPPKIILTHIAQQGFTCLFGSKEMRRERYGLKTIQEERAKVKGGRMWKMEQEHRRIKVTQECK